MLRPDAQNYLLRRILQFVRGLQLRRRTTMHKMFTMSIVHV